MNGLQASRFDYAFNFAFNSFYLPVLDTLIVLRFRCSFDSFDLPIVIIRFTILIRLFASLSPSFLNLIRRLLSICSNLQRTVQCWPIHARDSAAFWPRRLTMTSHD